MDTSKYLTIPYKWDGRDWTGCDCYGLIMLFFKEEFGITLHDFYRGNYEDYISGNYSMIESSHVDWEEIELYELKLGDVVILYGRGGSPSHCGVMIDDSRMMHSCNEHGCSIIRTSRIKNLLHSAYRHKELK